MKIPTVKNYCRTLLQWFYKKTTNWFYSNSIVLSGWLLDSM